MTIPNNPDIPILIPAYNPDETLLEVVDGLIRLGINNIIIVNDGSTSQCDPIFNSIEKQEQCRVLNHAVNCGKGRALKTGLNHIYLNFPGIPGVVTADADGQHDPKDILEVSQCLANNPGKLVLGVRKLKGNIPFRSRLGNTFTRWTFSFMIGKTISDTQTGLRGLPYASIPQLLKINGERYEYEINMLIHTRERNIDIVEQSIDTIYIENNKSSHFNPLFDSMRIYFQLLRYTFSSLLASSLDFLVFTLVFNLSTNLIISLLIGRFVVGSLVNYSINKRFVFHSKSGVLVSLMKYYLALIVMSLLSYLLIDITNHFLGIKIIYAKILVESLLFVFSFMIQREFVFASKSEPDTGMES